MSKLPEYITAAAAIHAAALAIVNLTPTPRDNEALGNISRVVVRVYRAVEILAGIWSPLAKR